MFICTLAIKYYDISLTNRYKQSQQAISNADCLLTFLICHLLFAGPKQVQYSHQQRAHECNSFFATHRAVEMMRCTSEALHRRVLVFVRADCDDQQRQSVCFEKEDILEREQNIC